jgi:DNA mismatch endonuclease, patch repair protein
MSRIRGRDTGPELPLRKALCAMGVRYRLDRGVLGQPDIVFKAARVVVFVDGCFWHRCPTHGVMPKNNSEFWKTKIRRNVERDDFVTARLADEGWTVLRFWEHDVEGRLPWVTKVIRVALGRAS